MPELILFALMLVVMLMRVYMPLGAKVGGKVTQTLHMSLPEKALMQRVNVYAIGGVLLLMAVTGLIAPVIELVVVAVALGILTMPVRILMTSEGVGLNNVVYRPWKEFSSFSCEKRRITLNGRDGARPLHLYILPDHQKQALPVLRRHLSEAKASQTIRAKAREATTR
jgi:hypothetical protein